MRAVLERTPAKPKWRANYRESTVRLSSLVFTSVPAHTHFAPAHREPLHVQIYSPSALSPLWGGNDEPSSVPRPRPRILRPLQRRPRRPPPRSCPVPALEQANVEVFRVTFYEYRVIP